MPEDVPLTIRRCKGKKKLSGITAGEFRVFSITL
jgi:hypothetical protein